MTPLLDEVLEAHGGLARWKEHDIVRATFLSSGGLLPMKGLEAPPRASEGIASIREQSLVIEGYRQPDWRMKFTPQRVAVETVFDIGGGIPVAQYVHDLVEADGFWFPTKRRAYVRSPSGKPIHDLLLISIDISGYHVERR
jgi:hypothetical protein